MTTLAAQSSSCGTERLEAAAFVLCLAFVAALQLSIAAADILLTGVFALWAALVVLRRERIAAPPFFRPLLVYAAATLVAAAFSRDPRVSWLDSKQLVLFAVVPAVYRLARGDRAATVASLIVTVGALSAALGIVQYGILEYDHLGRRPQGALGHYMTYSGLLMLVTCLALALVLFSRRERAWPGVVLPALLVALALTFTRSAWVGACVGIGVLLLLKDLRLAALLPVGAALFVSIAPAALTSRLYSMFDLQDPTNRDRLAMARAGWRMIRDSPLTGVGPDVVRLVYPQYRDPEAVQAINPHLHNVPMHIAAERGLPALVIWIWFVVTLVRSLVRKLRESRAPALAAGGLAAVAAMLAAGLFEYNFGDSEFLMLFLVLVTLPHAVDEEHVSHPS